MKMIIQVKLKVKEIKVKIMMNNFRMMLKDLIIIGKLALEKIERIIKLTKLIILIKITKIIIKKTMNNMKIITLIIVNRT
jgi:hypothetical protein